MKNRYFLNYFFKNNLKYSIKYQNVFPNGFFSALITMLLKKKQESKDFFKIRLISKWGWCKKKFPYWLNLKLKYINFKNILYYSIIRKNSSLKIIDLSILNAFKKLGIFLNKNKKLTFIARETILDSISINSTYKEKLAKYGIIFCSISEAIQYYPCLVKKFFGSVVPLSDNFFANLNSIVFSDGSFCYIPQNIKCPLDLSTYFRINTKNLSQFERTLIIVEKNSFVNYLESCTAVKYNQIQLHAAVVELVAFENAIIKYSTIQNWYSGNNSGNGGIYNFVTKRGLTLGNNSTISWTQVETGASITWKYPSCILLGNNSCGNFYSIALTKNYQQADTGTKMIHLGLNTKSNVISKGILFGNSKNFYRGLIKIGKNAHYSNNFSKCDSFLLNSFSIANTYPYLDSWNSTSRIEHEAKISKISYEQLFYFQQRNINLEQSIYILINGFCREIFLQLPMEFLSEIEKLIFMIIKKLK